MSNRICVAVRKRPCGPDDKDVVVAQSPQCIVNEPKVKYDLTPYTDRHTFIYDAVLDQGTNNREVYQRCCQPLIDTLFSYANATCFAYGQTGSGKTHTMLGNDHEPGLYACAAKDVFSRCKTIKAEVYASFYEIYGRKLFDLLNDRNKLVAREDGNKEIVICGLTEHAVSNIDDLFQIISRGSTYRAAGQTSANAESSRSHAVLQMEVRENGGKKTIGRISFIDLAGNERGADTFDCDRKTRMEGAEINKSLLALKECIRALGMGKSHIPFRGSVLTGVLRDSFLGNSRTTMIATISPTAAHCENTLNTLRYTQRVKDLGGAAGGGREMVMEDKGPRRNVQAGRRKPSGNVNHERPGWVDDFVDDKPLDNEIPPPPKVRQMAAKKQGIIKPKIVDPRIATIVQNHMGKMEEDELSPTDEDDDEDSGNEDGAHQRGAANKEVKQVRAVHAHVVQAIAKAEDEIMAVHRHHIDLKMAGIKEEIKAIQALDDKDSVDEYVNKVKEILTKQKHEIGNIMDKLSNLQSMLKDEEDLSRTLTPAVRARGQGRPNYGR